MRLDRQLTYRVAIAQKFWQGGNSGEQMSFANISSYPAKFQILVFVKRLGYCKFANVFLPKALRRWIRQSFITRNFALYDYRIA